MTDTTSEQQAAYGCDTHDPYEVPRIRGTKRPVDTGTIWAMKTFPSDECLDELTPEGVRWAAEQMRGHALSYVNSVFDWVVSDVPECGQGCVAFMMAEASMSTGRSLPSALDNLLADAARFTGKAAGPCAEPDNPECECGACAYAAAIEVPHMVVSQ